MKIRTRNTPIQSSISTKRKSKMSRAWQIIKGVRFRGMYVGCILAGSLMLISYANFGIVGIASPIFILAGLIGIYVGIGKLWNMGWEKIFAFQKSKIIFRESSLSDSLYIPQDISYENLQHNMEFYPKQELVSKFYQYLFWKDFIVSVHSFYLIFFMIFATLFFFIDWKISFGTILFFAFGISFSYFLFSMRKFLNFMIHKKDITILSLELKPKLYSYTKDKNIFFH